MFKHVHKEYGYGPNQFMFHKKIKAYFLLVIKIFQIQKAAIALIEQKLMIQRYFLLQFYYQVYISLILLDALMIHRYNLYNYALNYLKIS